MIKSLLEAVTANDFELTKTLLLNGDYDFEERNRLGMNCLHVSALQGHYDITCELIKYIPSLIESICLNYQMDGVTPLHLAVKQGHENVVKLLIINGANINTEFGRRKQTMLHEAAFMGHTSIVNILLEFGANVNANFGSYGGTALHEAVFKKHLSVVEILLNRGANVNERFKLPNFNNGFTALHHAALKGNIPMLEILLRCGADVNSTFGYRNVTPLQEAASKGIVTVVEKLLQYGAQVNANCGTKNGTALHQASLHGHVDVIEILIKYGADINVTDRYEKSALHYGTHHKNVVRCLIRHGLDVNHLDHYHNSPLSCAAVENRPEVVKLLLASGADVDCLNMDNETVLMKMARHSHGIQMMHILIQYKPKIMIKSVENSTLLHLAVKNERIDMIDYLIVNMGIDLNAINIKGDTAFQLACECKNVNVVSRLLNYNCDISIHAEEIALMLLFMSMEERNLCKLTRNIIILLMKHCERLDVSNRRRSVTYDVLFENPIFTKFIKEFKEKCIKEVDALKKLKLSNTSVLSFYDVLTGNFTRVSMCLQHVNMFLYNGKYLLNQFPIYGIMIQLKLQLAFKRKPLIYEIEEAVFKSNNFFSKLPYICSHNVIKYLPNNDLKNLIQAVGNTN